MRRGSVRVRLLLRGLGALPWLVACSSTVSEDHARATLDSGTNGTADGATAATLTPCAAELELLAGLSPTSSNAMDCSCPAASGEQTSTTYPCAATWADEMVNATNCTPTIEKKQKLRCSPYDTVLVQGIDSETYCFYDASGALAGEIREAIDEPTCASYGSQRFVPPAGCSLLDQTGCPPPVVVTPSPAPSASTGHPDG